MKRYLTIDGGTPNTRINLIVDGSAIASKRLNRGAKAGIDDREGLKNALKDAIAALLNEHSLTEQDVSRVIASGMITSEFGLLEVPHIFAPAGIAELHDSMADTAFPEITEIPFSFIRGVRMDTDSLDEFDMMRGEETELCGLSDLCFLSGEEECVCVLPGSHSKIVRLDRRGRIAEFSTMLTGEMIAALSSGTILKDAVDLSIELFDEDFLKEGFEYARSVGLNKALFKVRILKNRFKKSPTEVYSFFLGAILADEIGEILKIDAKRVIIGGRKQIKEAMATLLRSYSDKQITVVDEADVERSTAHGAIRIYEYTPAPFTV